MKKRYAVTDNGDYEWIIDTSTDGEMSPRKICDILNACDQMLTKESTSGAVAPADQAACNECEGHGRIFADPDETHTHPCGKCHPAEFQAWLRKQEELADAIKDLEAELQIALSVWPSFNSAHEGYGVLKEEFVELEKEIFLNQKKRDPAKMRTEALQVAAMAVRLAVEICKEPEIRK